jgi:hypothetical protein
MIFHVPLALLAGLFALSIAVAAPQAGGANVISEIAAMVQAN